MEDQSYRNHGHYCLRLPQPTCYSSQQYTYRLALKWQKINKYSYWCAIKFYLNKKKLHSMNNIKCGRIKGRGEFNLDDNIGIILWWAVRKKVILASSMVQINIGRYLMNCTLSSERLWSHAFLSMQVSCN